MGYKDEKKKKDGLSKGLLGEKNPRSDSPTAPKDEKKKSWFDIWSKKTHKEVESPLHKKDDDKYQPPTVGGK